MPVPSKGPLRRFDDTVLLLCSSTKFNSDDEGRFLGITTDAFRVDDDGISVTWLEYHTPPPPQIEQAAAAIKAGGMKPTPSGIIAHASVGRILELAQKAGLQIEITHTPVDENPAHCSIEGCPDDPAKLNVLARAFVDHTFNKDISGFLPPKKVKQ